MGASGLELTASARHAENCMFDSYVGIFADFSSGVFAVQKSIYFVLIVTLLINKCSFFPTRQVVKETGISVGFILALRSFFFLILEEFFKCAFL